MDNKELARRIFVGKQVEVTNPEFFKANESSIMLLPDGKLDVVSLAGFNIVYMKELRELRKAGKILDVDSCEVAANQVVEELLNELGDSDVDDSQMSEMIRSKAAELGIQMLPENSK